MAPNKSTASTGAGVVKRRYEKVRFHEDGLLNVERKRGKYFKMAQQNQRQSPLLRLPAELRNTIFAYALGGKTFKVDSVYQKYKSVTKSKHALALLQVCRQIYAETTLLPFSMNTFSTSYPSIFAGWAESLHPARAQSINWVQVNFRPEEIFPELIVHMMMSDVSRFGDLLLSSQMCNRGYVTFTF